ncbi:MAG: hypothetical protein JFR38_00975 [Muribaculaceae bacterium]|nr:hypothetical protein [Muribaculaceae bacterium]
MYAHLFIKWYGRKPTRFQEAVISHLERHRWRHGGHLRACIDTTGAPVAQLEPILTAYLRFLRDTYTPWGEVIIADRTRTLATHRRNATFDARDRTVHALSGRTRFGTRRGVQPTQAIAFNLHNYGAHLLGDPRARDTIINLLNTVPHIRGSAVILVGRYRSNCLSFFASYYYNMRRRHTAAGSGDGAAVLPLAASQVISQREQQKLKWLSKPRRKGAPTARSARDSLRPPAAILSGRGPELTARNARNQLSRKIVA